MGMSWFKWRYFLYLAIIGLWFIWFVNIRVNSASNLIAVDCDRNIDSFPVGIVLGARVFSDKSLSDVYRDRLDTAIRIYENGKIDKILISGDHGQLNYDEVNAGKNYLLENGIPGSDIFLDHAGFDTYDSIYRAKNIFQIDKALIITQKFHLPRALYFSEALEINALGCEADLHEYRDISKMKQREIFARVKAWFSVACGANPKYLGPVHDIGGDGEQTWDEINY